MGAYYEEDGRGKTKIRESILLSSSRAHLKIFILIVEKSKIETKLHNDLGGKLESQRLPVVRMICLKRAKRCRA
jgi:hypothetical protein